MPTNRRPRRRESRWVISDAAAAAFKAIRELPPCSCPQKAWLTDSECASCREWNRLHHQLLDEMRHQTAPFMYPLLERDGGPGPWANWGAEELWAALEAAAK